MTLNKRKIEQEIGEKEAWIDSWQKKEVEGVISRLLLDFFTYHSIPLVT